MDERHRPAVLMALAEERHGLELIWAVSREQHTGLDRAAAQ